MRVDRTRPEPDWQAVLASAARLQELVPDAVLVGGTGAAAHAGHRVSFDHDHVVVDLRDRFDQVLDALEASDGWVTARLRRPVLILGSLEGVDTGVRQLIRRRPLEVEAFEVDGKPLHVPTLPEALRVKAWLALTRNATRDYLDVVALAERLGAPAPETVQSMDDYYADQRGPGGARIATQVVKQLAHPLPYDLDEVELARYRRLAPRWQDWDTVAAACRRLAADVLDRVAEERP
jgi:hypothetical protein